MLAETGVIHARFQVLHLKHMEYILAAKMRCRKLYIGITNPDSLHTKDIPLDINRSAKSANPLTYFERSEIIKGAMTEFGVPESEYEIIPFPISYPEYILQYAPKDAVYYMGIFDDWDEERYKRLKSLGLNVVVLWKKTPEEKGITGSMIRNLIATDQEWAQLVPKSVYRYLTDHHLDERIRRLEKMRLDEKEISLIKD